MDETLLRSETLPRSRLSSDLIRLRRFLHRHPELGFEEHQTARLVARKLAQLGLVVATEVGGTGVVGLLPGPAPGPTVALRADMDALPLQDQKNVPYASGIPGKMHACGHDAHVACLLGAAALLAELRASLAGSVKFIFQPAEETNQGARAMIRDGVLEHPRVDAIVALHVNAELPSGTVVAKEGPIMAAEDNFTLRIKGESAHAASPHRGADAIVAAAQVVMALQTVVSRNLDPLEAAVVSICTINGGRSRNILCDNVEMQGTVRTLSPQVRRSIPARIRNILESLAAGYGTGAELEYQPENPPVFNDPYLTSICREAICQTMGEKTLAETSGTMASEDFSFFQECVPGTFLWLGVRKEPEESIPLHSPLFDLDEPAMEVGATVLTNSAIYLLKNLSLR